MNIDFFLAAFGSQGENSTIVKIYIVDPSGGFLVPLFFFFFALPISDTDK